MFLSFASVYKIFPSYDQMFLKSVSFRFPNILTALSSKNFFLLKIVWWTLYLLNLKITGQGILAVSFFPSWLVGSIYVIDLSFLLHFFLNDFDSTFVSIFFVDFFHTVDTKTVPSRTLFMTIQTPIHCFLLFI